MVSHRSSRSGSATLLLELSSEETAALQHVLEQQEHLTPILQGIAGRLHELDGAPEQPLDGQSAEGGKNVGSVHDSGDGIAPTDQRMF